MDLLLEVDVWHLELQDSILVERKQSFAEKGIIGNSALSSSDGVNHHSGSTVTQGDLVGLQVAQLNVDIFDGFSCWSP